MIVDGKKPCDGEYKLTRCMIMKNTTPIYTMKIAENITIWEADKDITDQIRHLDFKKDDVVFLWRSPCKVGLPFKISFINEE